uniref:Uncharacterized protein n=1 Tax=viral metagenome TaxID=1070528 RepID=A0A6C0E574_9ZZZZ
MSTDAAYRAMMLKLREDHIKKELGIRQSHQTAEQEKEEAERRIAYQESMIQQEARAAASRQQALAQQQQQAAQQQAEAQQQAQQEQTALNLTNDTQYPQVQGGISLGGLGKFLGGRRKYNKSPRRINKTRRSGKRPRKSRRLYINVKSRKRRR